MNLGQLFTYCNYMVNKDQRGNPATPEQFPILVNVAQNKFYSMHYLELLRLSNEKGTPISDLIFSNTQLKRYLKKYSSSDIITDRIFRLPTDFRHELSCLVMDGDRPITNKKNVDLRSSIQFDRDISQELRDDLDVDVPGMIRPDLNGIEIATVWDKMNLTYLREIIDVVYDYCYDQLGNVYYMEPGWVIKEVNGLKNLYNDSDVLQVSNVTHNTATAFPYTSKSVELDVDKDYHDEIARIIVVDMSIKERELQVASAKSST